MRQPGMDSVATVFPGFDHPWDDVSGTSVWITAARPPQTVLYQFKRGGWRSSSGRKSSWKSRGSSSYMTGRGYGGSSGGGSSGGSGPSTEVIISVVFFVLVVLVNLFCCVMIHLNWRARKDQRKADARTKQRDGQHLTLPRITPCTNTAFYKLRVGEAHIVDPLNIVVHPTPSYPAAPTGESWLPPYPASPSPLPCYPVNLPPYPITPTEPSRFPVTSDLHPYSLTSTNFTSYPAPADEPTPYSSYELPPHPLSPYYLPPYPSASPHLPPYPHLPMPSNDDLPDTCPTWDKTNNHSAGPDSLPYTRHPPTNNPDPDKWRITTNPRNDYPSMQKILLFKQTFP